MTITKATRPRLINARGMSTRPTRTLVEMSIANGNEDTPVEQMEEMWGNEQHAAAVLHEIEVVCGSRKLTSDAQKLSMIQEKLTHGLAAAEKLREEKEASQPKPMKKSGELNESVELIEADTLILPGGRYTKVPGWASAKKAAGIARAGVRLIHRRS